MQWKQTGDYILGRSCPSQYWGSYDFIAAENIDGVNSVLWKVGDDDYAYYWLDHNDEWDYFGSGDVGWEGDPSMETCQMRSSTNGI